MGLPEGFSDIAQRLEALEAAVAERDRRLNELSTGVATTFAFLIQTMEESEPGTAGPLIRTIEAMRESNPPGAAAGAATIFFYSLAVQLRRAGLIK
jgi:uncharacterized coiled-coil protein SlyX